MNCSRKSIAVSMFALVLGVSAASGQKPGTKNTSEHNRFAMTIHTLTVNGLSAWMKCRIGKCGNKSISFDVHRSVVTGEPFYEILNKYGISFFMDYASRDHGLGIMQTDKNTLQLKTIVQELAAHSENLKGSGFIPQDDYIAMGDRAIEKQKDKILKFLDGKD